MGNKNFLAQGCAKLYNFVQQCLTSRNVNQYFSGDNVRIGKVGKVGKVGTKSRIFAYGSLFAVLQHFPPRMVLWGGVQLVREMQQRYVRKRQRMF